MGALHKASIEGSLTLVKQLIEANPSLVNAKDEHGRTPLHLAAIEGHDDVAALLLVNSADIDARDAWGRTPLFVGIYEEPLVCDHSTMVNFLVSKGASVNVRDNVGDTPLHMAAAFGETEVVEVLLNSGSEVNATNEEGDTPLHKAVLYPESNTIKILLKQANININIKNGRGLTPREIAIDRGWQEIAELLSVPLI